MASGMITAGFGIRAVRVSMVVSSVVVNVYPPDPPDPKSVTTRAITVRARRPGRNVMRPRIQCVQTP